MLLFDDNIIRESFANCRSTFCHSPLDVWDAVRPSFFMNPILSGICIVWVWMSMLGIDSAIAGGWVDLTGKTAVPRLIAFNSSKTPPKALPFVAERRLEAGFWTSFADAGVIEKTGQTTVKSSASGWQDTGLWLHALIGRDWVSLPIYESPNADAGAVMKGNEYFALHATFWKSLQATRPPSKSADPAAVGAKPRTGSFTVNLGKLDGQPVTPDDRKKNPFYKFKGDPAQEAAEVLVPTDYDGTKPFGLMVYISPAHDGNNGISAKWSSELAARHIIRIGPKKAGNNQSGERRVWLAQLARAWALHHYRIDPDRMVIAGLSNGADAASATAVSTPFGFNSALLFAPPCEPPIGPVHVPRETDHSSVKIQPLSDSGLSYIKRTWRIVHVVGAKDEFLNLVRRSANAVDHFKMGTKLFEIPGLGHALPASIAEPLDFLDSPRSSASDGDDGFSPTSYLVEIRRAMAENPSRGRAAMIQLWNNHPEARNHPDVLALLATMEALP